MHIKDKFWSLKLKFEYFSGIMVIGVLCPSQNSFTYLWLYNERNQHKQCVTVLVWMSVISATGYQTLIFYVVNENNELFYAKCVNI